MEMENSFSVIVRAISTVLGISSDAISCTATFVELGGDSLSAILISSECHKHGISIPASVFLRTQTLDDAIRRAVSSPKTLSAPTSFISHDSMQLDVGDMLSIKKVDSSQSASPTCGRGVTVGNVLDKVEASKLTEMQLNLLQESLQNPNLNMIAIQETYDEWDIETVCHAWTTVILAEPIFHDLIQELDIPPEELCLWQKFQTTTKDEFDKILLKAMSPSHTISKLMAIQSPTDDKHITIIWHLHHFLFDGYSARILLDKICRRLQGETVKPGASFLKTIYLLRTFQDERRESTRCFWTSKKEQYPAAVSRLCTSPQQVATASEITHGCIAIQFPDERLTAACIKTGYTRAVLIAAAWALTLGAFTGAGQVSFGLVFSGRDLPIPGAFDTIGPLVNTLPLYVSIEHQGNFVQSLLRQIHDDMLELNDHQYSDAADGADRQFDSLMATQFECDREPSETIAPANLHSSGMQSGVPLSLVIKQKGRVEMLYSTSRYMEEDVSNIRSVFRHSMNNLLQESPSLQTMLPPDMENQVRLWSNCDSEETLDSSKKDDLVTLFESVVARRPNDTAVIQDRFKMSYGSFNQAAAIIAQKLDWINPNEPVCVIADRSVNWLVAIFGILKAGGVYTPLDPLAPVAVRQANFELCGARAILIPTFKSQKMCFQQKVSTLHERIIVEEILTNTKSHKSMNYLRRHIAFPDALAYICFTSGSTGRPKAVQCTHKGLVAFQKDPDVRLHAEPGIVIAQVMSPVFDGSIHEIFSALTYGATLRLAHPEQPGPFSHLEQCDAAILTPSIAKALCPDEYTRLKYMYLVGESVPQSVCDDWGGNRLLFNMYGPTEATCGATIKRLIPYEAVTLGRPNPSSRVYILNQNRLLSPPGMVGMIYIAGIQVSHGYIDLPEENASRFFDDSILPQANQKMYMTGDMGYWDSSTGSIRLIGRKDRQIKLRGFRLDLEDLETRVATAIPGCKGAAVFHRDDHLVAAYLSPSISEASAKTYIRQHLPPYATPRTLISLDKFPLTLAGKLDYKALENLHVSTTRKKLPPQIKMTKTERVLVEAVGSLLDRNEEVEADQDSDIMMLGAHSILQLKLANRLSSLFGIRLPVRTIIENPIISALASAIDIEKKKLLIEDHSGVDEEPTVLGQSGVAPIEQYWFSKYKRSLGTSSFNVSHVSELAKTFPHQRKLISAWNTVLARHEILRCRFLDSGCGLERLYATEPPKAQYLEYFSAREHINREFQLESEDPIRVFISESCMLVCISHIICDYTTLDRLFEEFTAEFCNNELSIPQRRYQDTNWSLDVPQQSAEFWRNYVSNVDLFSMPCMKPGRKSFTGESLLFILSTGTMGNLRMLSKQWGLTMHHIALGAVSLVLQAGVSTNADILLGSPFLGRHEKDMRTVGLFLQPFPIRIPYLSDESSVKTFLKSVQQSAQSALSHSIDWSALMRVLAGSGDDYLRTAATVPAPNHPLFNTMVTFHELGSGNSRSICGVEPVVSWAEGSKFALMFEFSAVSASEVTLRLEYDSDLFSPQEIRQLAACIDVCLEVIRNDTTIRKVEQSLLGISQPEVREIEFGTSLAALI